jgi:site-specific recombinase XerD
MQRLDARLRRRGVRGLAGTSKGLTRGSLQHSVANLRSFLRFLSSRGDIDQGLDTSIDTPRMYRGEQLPRALRWDTVRAFLAAIDRTTPMGRRDYAMFVLIATYGLRASEVAALRLDDIEWRRERICVQRRKVSAPLVLPLTAEAGSAILDYVRRDRPKVAHRQLFLRVRVPFAPLVPTAVSEAFQTWKAHSRLPIGDGGPHCLRHSLAVHLLRAGASLKMIGDLLGHRSPESTSVYLRLHVADLRDVVEDHHGLVARALPNQGAIARRDTLHRES